MYEGRVVDGECSPLRRTVTVPLDERAILASDVPLGGFNLFGRKRRGAGDEGGEDQGGDGQDMGDSGHVCAPLTTRFQL